MRPARIGVAGAIAAAALGAALQLSAAPALDAAAVEAMEMFLARPPIPHQYQASRRLDASGGGRRGWIDVQTNVTTAAGFQYEVMAEGGSGYIRTRVLRSLLEEERRLIATGRTSTVAISTTNYRFSPERIDEDGLAIVRITPLRKDRSLLDGRLFLTPLDGELVRVEGRLAKNPSFWVTRVDVVRSYQRIDGVIMPVSLDTRAQLRFFGSSALRMTYQYSHIDERPVSDAQAP